MDIGYHYSWSRLQQVSCQQVSSRDIKDKFITMKWYMKYITHWSSQWWTQFLQLPMEAWQIQVQWVLRSNQLSDKVTEYGIWSFLGSNEPMRNQWMMKSFHQERFKYQCSAGTCCHNELAVIKVDLSFNQW